MTGAELAEARHRLDMTQQQLADALGLSRLFVSQMETGVRGVAERTAAQVRQLEELAELRRLAG